MSSMEQEPNLFSPKFYAQAQPLLRLVIAFIRWRSTLPDRTLSFDLTIVLPAVTNGLLATVA